MLFSKKSQYALKSLATLAAHGAYPGKGEPMLVVDLAKKSGVPGPFLGKIISELSTAEIVHTRKGRGGGVMLTRHPREIILEECLEAVGLIQGKRACVLQPKPCSDSTPCPLHSIAKGIRTKVLEKTTLAAVVGDGKWLNEE